VCVCVCVCVCVRIRTRCWWVGALGEAVGVCTRVRRAHMVLRHAHGFLHACMPRDHRPAAPNVGPVVVGRCSGRKWWVGLTQRTCSGRLSQRLVSLY
jgi:hypothetical protein